MGEARAWILAKARPLNIRGNTVLKKEHVKKGHGEFLQPVLRKTLHLAAVHSRRCGQQVDFVFCALTI